MPAPQQSLRLLERATALHLSRDYHSLRDLLTPLQTAELLSEPELGYWLALAQYMTGQEEKALGLVRRISLPCQNQGNERLCRRRATLEGILWLESGELEKAEDLFLSVLASASDADDQQMIGWANNNLAIIETIRCRWSRALTAYERALASLQRVGDYAQITRCHHNLGMVFRQLGHLEQADSHFMHALSFARTEGTNEEVTYIEFERALLIHQRGDTELAVTTAERALGLAESLNNKRLEGEALRVLGKLFGEMENWDKARSYLNDALTIARTTSTRLLAAEVLEELAWIESANGNRATAVEFAEQSVELYQSMGAAVHAGRVYQRIFDIDSDRKVI